jgi:hypothetical protein
LGSRTIDVPRALREQTARIEREYGRLAASQLIDVVERLASARPLEPNVDLDVISMLDAAGREAVGELVKKALPAATSFEDREVMNALLFRASELSPDDAAVRSFVDIGMRYTLEARTGTYQSRQKHFNYHDARDALLGCKRIFDLAGKRFFLDRGTLLGCVREGGFIASDYDIDVGIFADEIDLDEVKQLFDGTEFTLTQDFEYKVGVASPTGIQIDFFLTTRERGYFLSKGYRSIHNWYFTPFDLMEYEFLGERFLIPATYEKHLDENYGNWRSPAIFYDLSYNEPCVAHGHGPEAFSYLSKRLSRALRRGWRYYSQAAAEALARTFDVDVLDRLPRRHEPTVAPIEPPGWSPRPIIVVDDFQTYRPHQRRVIESALSLSADVHVEIVDSESDTSDAILVASAIDRLSDVRELQRLVDHPDRADAQALAARGPMAVAIARRHANLLSSTDVAALLDAQCDVVFFDESTIALGLESGRVVGRSGEISS